MEEAVELVLHRAALDAAEAVLKTKPPTSEEKVRPPFSRPLPCSRPPPPCPRPPPPFQSLAISW